MDPAISFDDVEVFGDRIRKCETYKGISLYHYRSADENDDSRLKQIRGVVFNDQKQLVMRGFPFTPEYTHDDPTIFSKIGQVEKYQVFPSYEGTIVRVFWHDNEWFVSTHKKLFATESFWANRNLSFGEQFKIAVEFTTGTDYASFFTRLDKTRQYMFLITPLFDNRVVSVFPTPNVIHVGTFINHRLDMSDNIGLPVLYNLTSQFKTLEDVTTYVAGTSPLTQQGVLLIGETGCFKIVSKMYSFLYSIRGNQPNLENRFFQLKNEPEKQNLFVNIYPEHTDRFKNAQKMFDNFVSVIHREYLKRYVQRKFTFLPKYQHEILKSLHNLFIESGIKTTRDRVESFLANDNTKM